MGRFLVWTRTRGVGYPHPLKLNCFCEICQTKCTYHDEQGRVSSVETEANEETGAEAYTTVTENHFGIAYTSVSREKSVSYTTGDNTAEYSYQTTGTDEDEKLSADSVKYNDSVILSSAYTYDDNGNVHSKSYGENNSIVNTLYDILVVLKYIF